MVVWQWVGHFQANSSCSTTFMDVKPPLPELLQHANIGVHWYNVGILLKIEAKKLDEIQQEHCNKLPKMYHLWLELNPKATRRQLIEALKCIGQNSTAAEYEYWIQQQPPAVTAAVEEVDCAGVINDGHDNHLNNEEGI